MARAYPEDLTAALGAYTRMHATHPYEYLAKGNSMPNHSAWFSHRDVLWRASVTTEYRGPRHLVLTLTIPLPLDTAAGILVELAPSVTYTYQELNVHWDEHDPVAVSRLIGPVFDHVRDWFPKAKQDKVAFRVLAEPNRRRIEIRGRVLPVDAVDIELIVAFEPGAFEPPCKDACYRLVPKEAE